MKVGAIIFSRMSSSRLPSKALIEINGRSLLGRVIDITKLIEGVDEIVVATSTKSEDEPIKKFVKNEEITLFRGNLNDVCVRALDVCNKYNFDKFVRICGDRPFFCHKIITHLISVHNRNDVDVVIYTERHQEQEHKDRHTTPDTIMSQQVLKDVHRYSKTRQKTQNDATQQV